MSATRLRTDGSAASDRPREVVIDPDSVIAKWRYTCPRGDTTIDSTNGGYWCRACSRDPEVEDPHYHELVDNKTNERVPWSAVTIKERVR